MSCCALFRYSKAPTIIHSFDFVAEHPMSISRERLFQNSISI